MNHEGTFVNAYHAALGFTVAAVSTVLPDGLSDTAKLILAFPTGFLTMFGAACATAIINRIKAHYAAKAKKHPLRRVTDRPQRNRSHD